MTRPVWAVGRWATLTHQPLGYEYVVHVRSAE